MQATVKPKQADDPHDVLEIAPGVALVAPSNAADPTDEELSNLLRAAARQRPGAKAGSKPNVAAGSLAPAVDTTFRPAAGNNVRRKGDRWSMGKPTIRGVAIGFVGVVLALSVGVGVAAWQSYGDATARLVATWGPQLGLATSASPQDSGLAEQPSPVGVQPAEVTPAAEPSIQSVPQAAAAVAAVSPPGEAPTLQSMARDVATLEQKVEQLQATIEQLKASQDQMSRDVGKGLDVRTSDAKATDQNLRPRTSAPAPRQAVVPPRRPIPVFRQPQATAAPTSPPLPASNYGQRQPESSSPAAQQLVDPESSSVPRPPMPLHQ